MVYANRTLVTCAILSAGFLSACADATNPTITRASQIDEILNQPPKECSYDVLSRSLAQSLRETEEGAELLRNLDDYCPDLVILEPGAGKESVTLAAVTTETPVTETPSSPADDTETPADTGTDTGETDTGTDTGESDPGTDTGETDSGTDTGSEDTGSNGGGSKGNNGSGNGSEGSSPGKGSGANQDE